MRPQEYSPCPVLLLTSKDRTRYLDTTLSSVLATLPDPKLLSVCCESISQRSLDYLATENRIWLGQDYCYPNENADWIKRINRIENKLEVVGLNNRVRVLPTTTLTGHDALLAFLLTVLSMHESCSHVVLIEDDVIFKEDWHSRLCSALAQHDDCGMIAGFRYPIRARNKIVLPDITLFEGGYSAVCVGLSAKLIRNMKGQGSAYNRRTMIRQDDWIVDNCVRLGMRQGYLNSGVCQHIGVESATWKGAHAKSYLTTQNRLGRIDSMILPPFVLGN